MWAAQDVARDTVRRQGAGLDRVQVADKITEAARRERETQSQLRAPAPVSELKGLQEDPQRLAEVWAARHTEWRRVAALMKQEGWPVYTPEQDVQGSTWAREREAQREGAIARRTAWEQQQRDARDELRTQVWLSADVSRRLREICARTGLLPEQVLAQLADQARLSEDGTLTAGPFTLR
ncbi:hypothetical protein [Streptomyces sp. NPDC005799]|uniref:hypothetical protein n=1 Tax=Streptomyces sp. NPDC005799 TaxID=3154678 RepID=UPI00340FBC3A